MRTSPWKICCRSAAWRSGSSSSIGTISGGTLMNRSSPSTSCVSLESARTLSFARALRAARRSASMSCSLTSASNRAASSFSSRRAYQTARLPIAAKRRIAVRYSRTPAVTAARRLPGLRSCWRQTISTLVAMRLTSHSHGPGSVSSKSLTSKTSVRSGAANAPKFEMWASPQICARRPERGVTARSAAMIAAPPR